MEKKLALLIHSGGATPDLIYPSLQKLDNVTVITFFIKSSSNQTLNALYDKVIGQIGPSVECYSTEDMMNQLVSYHSREPINGVMTLAEMLLETAAMICERIGCSFMPLHIVQNVQNKIKQRIILKNSGIPVPKFFEIRKEKDLRIAAERIGFPSVLKPNYGGGSYFVYKVNSYEELEQKYKESQINFENIIVERKISTFNLEENILGENWHNDNKYGDYASVESLVVERGVYHLSISDRTPLIPYFRETSCMIPTNLSSRYSGQLYEVTARAITALQLNNCAVHTELKFTHKGPVIIEVNARPGGPVPFLFKLATDGYDLFYELAMLALGGKVNTTLKFKKYATVKPIHCPVGRWKITSIENFDDTKSLNGVEVAIKIGYDGKIVSSYNGAEDLVALYYLTADSSHDLLTLMQKIDEVLYVEYEEVK